MDQGLVTHQNTTLYHTDKHTNVVGISTLREHTHLLIVLLVRLNMYNDLVREILIVVHQHQPLRGTGEVEELVDCGKELNR
jgi:hypothetical protein